MVRQWENNKTIVNDQLRSAKLTNQVNKNFKAKALIYKIFQGWV